jgi:hypothetical protein
MALAGAAAVGAALGGAGTLAAAVWVSANFVVSSPWPLVPVALVIWLAAQIRVRRLLGITWDPLVRSLGEL